MAAAYRRLVAEVVVVASGSGSCAVEGKGTPLAAKAKTETVAPATGPSTTAPERTAPSERECSTSRRRLRSREA